MFTGIFIRLHQEKTGEAPEFGGVFSVIYDVFSEETVLSPEEIHDKIAGGLMLAEIIEFHGREIDSIGEKLSEAIEEPDLNRGQDIEEFLASILD